MNVDAAIASWPIKAPDEGIWDFIERKGLWKSPLILACTTMSEGDVTQQMVADRLRVKRDFVTGVVNGWNCSIEQNLAVGDAVLAAIDERWRGMQMSHSLLAAVEELAALLEAVRLMEREKQS